MRRWLGGAVHRTSVLAFHWILLMPPVGGFTLESVIILAGRDKKCLFINIPGITHFQILEV